MKKFTFSVAMAVLLTSSAWGAQQAGDLIMEAAFKKADVIVNGRIDAGEFDIYNLSIFTALDVDRDTVLMEDECINGCSSTDLSADKNGSNFAAPYRYEALDTDGDAKISEDEYVYYARKQFRDYDRNEDKLLDKEEFFAFYQGIDERTFMVKNKTE